METAVLAVDSNDRESADIYRLASLSSFVPVVADNRASVNNRN